MAGRLARLTRLSFVDKLWRLTNFWRRRRDKIMSSLASKVQTSLTLSDMFRLLAAICHRSLLSLVLCGTVGLDSFYTWSRMHRVNGETMGRLEWGGAVSQNDAVSSSRLSPTCCVTRSRRRVWRKLKYRLSSSKTDKRKILHLDCAVGDPDGLLKIQR